MAHEGIHQFRGVIPMLVCVDAAAEIGFCKSIFGAVELSRRSDSSGAVVHAVLGIGETMLMVHEESPHLASRAPQADGSSPVVTYVYVESVDRIIENAVGEGARVLMPAVDAPWGDRVGRVIDPSSHVWNVAARIHQKP